MNFGSSEINGYSVLSKNYLTTNTTFIQNQENTFPVYISALNYAGPGILTSINRNYFLFHFIFLFIYFFIFFKKKHKM